MAEAIMIENRLSRFGLRVVEVVRYGERPEADTWVRRVPENGREQAVCHHWVEEEIGMHHLVVSWPAREMVILPPGLGLGREAALWWIGPKERVSWGLELAAELYWLETGKPATHGWVRELPPGAPERLDAGRVVLRLAAMRWVPAGYAAAGRGGADERG